MKLFSLISSAAIVIAIPLSSFCDSQMSDLEGRISSLEKTHAISVENHIGHQINSSGYNGSCQSSKNPSGSVMDYSGGDTEVHPKTTLDFSRGCHKQNGPYFDVEYLWLRAVEDGIGYAWEQSVSADGVQLSITPHDQDFEFDSGVRIGFGYDFPYDDWGLHSSYTWLSSYVHDSVRGPFVDGRGTIIATLGLLPINSGSLVYLSYEKAHSHWQLQFNSWDLDLGRNYYVGKHLAVKPICGFKGALIRQHLQAFYDQADLITRDDGGNQRFIAEFNDIQARYKSRFWGVGPKAGISGEWEFGSGFSLFGNIHAAALYGRFITVNDIKAIKVSERLDDLDDVGHNEGAIIRDDFYRLRPMMYLGIGLEWSRCFWDWMNFRMHVGWEGQYFWEQMGFLNFKDISPDGDLSLTGINAGFRFDF